MKLIVSYLKLNLLYFKSEYYAIIQGGVTEDRFVSTIIYEDTHDIELTGQHGYPLPQTTQTHYISVTSFTSTTAINDYSETVFAETQTIVDDTLTMSQTSITANLYGVMPLIEAYVFYIRGDENQTFTPLKVHEQQLCPLNS